MAWFQGKAVDLVVSGVFRPEAGVVAMNLGASAVLTALAAAIGVAVTVEHGPVWLAVIGAFILGGVWMMYRSVVMRVMFDGDTLHIVGLLRSRRIPRSAILTIERYDLGLPLVRWAIPGARDRWSVLTPLVLGSSAFLPSSMYRRRHRFLVILRRWAPDSVTDSVRPGMWTRAGNIGLTVIEAVWRSKAMRLVLALLLTAWAAYLYWFAGTRLLEVIQHDAELTRGLSGAAIVVAASAEAAYWLTPLRKRRPRRWHIALVITVAPLAALGAVALLK